MEELLSASIVNLSNIARDVSIRDIAPRADAVDSNAEWPSHSMQALAEAGLLGLHVPKRLGGHEQGLLALAVIGETIAESCASSSLCFAMHCVGTAVISAKATAYHEEKYLKPIAENKHITTLALSERGTGAHFYLPQTKLLLENDEFIVNGCKQFVTNGEHADSYVISTMASDQSAAEGEFNCLLVDSGTQGIEWMSPWQGLGMRGNASRAMNLKDVHVPAENLLGKEGDQIWYTFEVVAPYFLIAMAGTYVGVAKRALDIAIQHLKGRRYEHSGELLADIPTMQYRIAEMSIAVERTRGLLYKAAYKGDIGDPQATVNILMAKADAADLAVRITNEAMTCCGGMAYRDDSELSRLLRDARASHVMSPTTDLLKTWTGRLMLDLPII
ncbi:acyl-CoA dehydrogenase [Hahella sp. CCB-MM4]|uniref:acyl-CoA dehydrogenase family protein n=1 Tax=Hahella sp. (strain CCB-MM4) TaxID=1926491 RepID=UPI000B9B0C10|nr:acyl-CoA dehydrogenase family protein [Hahella sp. CCB-MM4]OZG69742.1 acyl-CoA dehydrogenase [Hahella sp. CCB-MM4]